MKLGEINIFRGVDTTTALGTYSAPAVLDYVKDTSDSLGNGTNNSPTNIVEVTNIYTTLITNTSISNFSDVSTGIISAPTESIMTRGSNGKWTYVARDILVPTATADTLGIVKPGAGLSINAGVLSIDLTDVPSSTITEQQIINWDLAFSWGDHSTFDYATNIGLGLLADTVTALEASLSGYSLINHTHSTYLPLSGGSMLNANLVSNMNAQYLNGHPDTDFAAYSHTHTTFLLLSGGTMQNTNLVTNLNAQYLNGHVDTYFATASHTHANYLQTTNPWIANWNLAYGWGDHSTAGYLKTVDFPTETDPIFSAWDKSTGISITASQVSDFNSAVDINPRVSSAFNSIHSSVTIGTANGLSLSGQQISLRLADSTHAGSLSAADWIRFDAGVTGGPFQPLEDQRLSVTSTVQFDTAQISTALVLPYTVDDSAGLGSLAGFDTGSYTLNRYSGSSVLSFLGVDPVDFYSVLNPLGYIHEITSADGTVTITPIEYLDGNGDPDTTKHGVDLSVQGLFRYNSCVDLGVIVTVLATKNNITSTFSGNTLTFTIPEGTRVISAQARINAYSSLIIKTGVTDMVNTSWDDRIIPVIQAWREDTKQQLMAVNIVPSDINFDEVTINGLINTTTNYIRIVF